MPFLKVFGMIRPGIEPFNILTTGLHKNKTNANQQRFVCNGFPTMQNYNNTNPKVKNKNDANRFL